MSRQPINKRKIINDPVYGFIDIPGNLIFDLIEHPYFQRLRRIKQLGLTHLVYPGALHTRFQHSIGAMHLMQEALTTLKAKGHKISHEEEEAALIAILLHDIGHGPFSHALENSIVQKTNHEEISSIFMVRLNDEFGNNLKMGIDIFNHNYKKSFLSQLVSSQLDMDRLDYLKRDSFFTGVSEGVIGTERIIKMLDVDGDNLVVEAKGIYSLEKFIVARRIMYWQVYLHKTVLSAENMLTKILKRARFLALKRDRFILHSGPQVFFKLQQQQSISMQIRKASVNFHSLTTLIFSLLLKSGKRTMIKFFPPYAGIFRNEDYSNAKFRLNPLSIFLLRRLSPKSLINTTSGRMNWSIFFTAILLQIMPITWIQTKFLSGPNLVK